MPHARTHATGMSVAGGVRSKADGKRAKLRSSAGRGPSKPDKTAEADYYCH